MDARIYCSPPFDGYSSGTTPNYKVFEVDRGRLVSAVLTKSVSDGYNLQMVTTQELPQWSHVIVVLDPARRNNWGSTNTCEFVICDTTEERSTSGTLYTYSCPWSLWYELSCTAVEAGTYTVDSNNRMSVFISSVLSRSPWEPLISGDLWEDCFIEHDHGSAWDILNACIDLSKDSLMMFPFVHVDDQLRTVHKEVYICEETSNLCSQKDLYANLGENVSKVTKRTTGGPLLYRVYPVAKGGVISHAGHTNTYDDPLDVRSITISGSVYQGLYNSQDKSHTGTQKVYGADKFVKAPDGVSSIYTWATNNMNTIMRPTVEYEIEMYPSYGAALELFDRVHMGFSSSSADVLYINQIICDLVGQTVTVRAGKRGSEKSPALASNVDVNATPTVKDAEAIKDCTITVPSTAPRSNASTLTTTVTLAGYTPVGIAGYKWNSGTRQNFFHIYRMDVTADGTVTVSVCNFHDTDNASGVIRIYVLMARNDTLSS